MLIPMENCPNIELPANTNSANNFFIELNVLQAVSGTPTAKLVPLGIVL
jgi:hypothetical protein